MIQIQNQTINTEKKGFVVDLDPCIIIFNLGNRPKIEGSGCYLR